MIAKSSTVVTAALEIHWGNVGSVVQGISGLLLAVFAIIAGTAGLPEWRAKQRQQRELAHEQAKEIRFNRQRSLNGWSRNGVVVYGVELVTEPNEVIRASDELAEGVPTEYVVLRVSESSSNVNRAHSLRNLIKNDGYVSRRPTTGEYEALELGLQQLLAGDHAQPPPD